MNPRARHRLALVLGLLVAGVGGLAVYRVGMGGDAESAAPAASGDVGALLSENGPAEAPDSGVSEDARAALATVLRGRFNRKNMRADEAVLTFKDADAYRRFLARAAGSGASVLGHIDGLFAVRVRVGDYDAFVRELAGNTNAYASVTANAIVAAPTPPVEQRLARTAVPVGENLLSVLGVTTDNSTWGKGVTIAVIDGGASPDAAFGTRLKYLDIGYGVTSLAEDGAHGTAVAVLAAGATADARGVAPAADVLSIRVTGSDGASDTFSLAQGIFAAVDAGAEVINISLGGYATSSVLGDAVDYALAAGVAVVAASGNDQAAQLAWPAAYSGVVSVGAVDGAGQQAIFSNSGAGLQLTAPGVLIQTAGLTGTRVNFSGTSASAPVVSGAIAAVLSQSPGLTAIQAADVLTTYSSDGGVAGADPDYGKGTLNLGWAMDRTDASRVDPVISSQNYDAASGTVSFVVQNQGAQAVSGLGLTVNVGGETSAQTLADLAPGASTTVTVPVDRAQLADGGKVLVRSQLVTPAGLVDQNLSNNRKSGVISGP